MQQVLASPDDLAAVIDKPEVASVQISELLQVLVHNRQDSLWHAQDSDSSSSPSSSSSSSGDGGHGSSADTKHPEPTSKGVLDRERSFARSHQQQQQQQNQSKLLQGLLQPWAHVIVQSMLLASDTFCKASNMSILLLLLEVSSDASGDLLAAFKCFKQSLLQPVLLQLLPHLQ
jgi:hypothetical protein